jgi:two-component system LytT family sensor kinase
MKEVIRKYEKWVILVLALFYFILTTLNLSNLYTNNRSSLPNHGKTIQLLTESQEYSPFLNGILPYILCISLVYAAWYVFHYKIFTAFKTLKFDYKLLNSSLAFLALTSLAFYTFYHLRIYWRYRYHSDINEYTLDYFTAFRYVTVFKSAAVAIFIMVAMEAFSQLVYFISEQLKFSRLLTILPAAIFFFALLVINIGLATDSMFVYRSLKFELFLGSFLLGCIVWIGQEVLVTFYKTKGPLVSLIYAFLFCMLGGIGFGIIYLENNLLSVSEQLTGNFPRILAIVIFLLLLAVAIAVIRYFIGRQSATLQTQIDLKSAELDQLRGQVNPHFLFNALNSLYSVSLKENAQATASGIQKLGDMMRFMLNENNKDLISLEKEIQQLENYITIQRIRIDETHEIKIVVNIQKTQKEVEIAPMLLNPFVENAFKHGISLRNPSWIFITLTHDTDTLYFKVHNSLHKNKEIDPEKHNTGIGLENVKKRLELIYPERHSLKIQATDHDFFVSLTIKY